MKTPKFWKSINFISILLWPLSLLYFISYKIRCLINFRPYKSKIPIICIGNLIAGGSGKTPLAIEIAKILKNNNKNYCFLSKGYGGNFKGIKKVDINDNFLIVGDEALILVKYGDTFISKNRVKGLKYINENFNYDYIIMDDGLQNPTFLKHIVILVINGSFGFGNNMFLPAGPLRDRLKYIYNKVDLVVINGDDEENITELCEEYDLPFTKVKIKANIENIDLNEEYKAFCGIGIPEKFKKTLEENNIKIKDFMVFEDHYKYTKLDIEKFKNDDKISLITTEKDWVKLDLESKKNIKYLDIFLQFKNKELIEELIK